MRDPSGSTRGSAATIPVRVCSPDFVVPSIEYAVAENVCTSVGAALSVPPIIGGAGSCFGTDRPHATAKRHSATTGTVLITPA